ncbi:MAG: hypothetical protein ACK4YO_01370, partial [Candidatus Altarchaeaceae archaeon]
LIESFKNFALNLKDEKNFIENLKKAREKIINESYEVMTINTINFVIHDLEKNKGNLDELKEILIKDIEKILKQKKDAEEKIYEFTENLIFDGAKILTHCYSKTVLNSIKRAKEKGKNFIVINTETRPNLTGRLTSKFLNELNIKNIHISDFGISRIINDIDFVLIGCDAIDENGIINKIGSNVISIVANFYNKKFYVLCDSLKFCKGCKEKYLKKKRKSEEIWDIKNENIFIENFAYDFVEKNNISGIISEYGKLCFDETIEKFKQKIL